ncbi:toll/interleukin-1 receptor domain-containing protein [Bacillus cereus]|uniref:toll/interleukin-1 receptor domain-containing protein n=2 Tax=Bacillus TaxID=1386 RepID=UPI0011A19850|nr:toll/interleukin-1 receptor domain-containing protein [Bacillus cereus]
MRTSGINLAATGNIQKSYREMQSRKKRCIFISHISIDKNTAIEIGEYIKRSGFDIYLDIYDRGLQDAVANDNHEAIVRSIERGIAYSTDILCLVSNETKNSWWVPYEIGFAKSQTNNERSNQSTISTLLLKEVDYIPSYLVVTNVLEGIKSLNEYLRELSKREAVLQKSMQTIPNVVEYYAVVHPLQKYLKQYR